MQQRALCCCRRRRRPRSDTANMQIGACNAMLMTLCASVCVCVCRGAMIVLSLIYIWLADGPQTRSDPSAPCSVRGAFFAYLRLRGRVASRNTRPRHDKSHGFGAQFVYTHICIAIAWTLWSAPQNQRTRRVLLTASLITARHASGAPRRPSTLAARRPLADRTIVSRAYLCIRQRPPRLMSSLATHTRAQTHEQRTQVRLVSGARARVR